MTKDKNPTISAEDKALLQLHLRDVKPLRGKAARADTHPSHQEKHNDCPLIANKPQDVVNARTTITEKITRTPIALKHLAHSSPIGSIYLSDYLHDPVSSEQIISFKQNNVPHKLLHDLRQNKIRWKAQLDLHGMTSDQAKRAFLSFIHEQYTAKNNCVLIVHGKGGRSAEAPILKNLCYHWLRQLPQILAVHSALDQHGGAGAVYVLLKSVHKNPLR